MDFPRQQSAFSHLNKIFVSEKMFPSMKTVVGLAWF